MFATLIHFCLLQTHQQRIDSHSRHFEYLSQWALSNIHEVRHIRLLLADIFNKNVAQSIKSENEEEEGNLIRNEIDTSFKEIRRSLKILEESAARWKKIMDPRALLPYNLVMSLEQMDIQSDNENTLRRIDWLVGRNEACRWLKRTNYRTEAIQLSLANCGRFLRNTTFVPLSSAMDLTHLSSIQMTFAVIDVHTRNPVLYIKVGEVMHCLLTFGNLCMENIIVRSLDESHCLPSYKPRFNRLAVSPLRRSQAMSELLHSQETSGISPNLLQNLDNVSESHLPSASQLDLRTPSRYVTFVQITEAARNALVHFANVAEPQTQMTALHQFCEWLATYTRLYQDVCVNCNRLLGCDATLPVLRTFTINPARACAQHEHCRGSNIAL